MPNYGSKKQNTGGAKSKAGANYDVGGSDMGFGSNKGARNRGHLKHPGGGDDQWKDTDNDRSGEGHGGGMTRPGGAGY